MPSFHNEGIYMPDGVISESAVAGGRNARARNTIEIASTRLQGGRTGEISALLDELRNALAATDDELGNASAGVHEQAAVVAEELAKDQPRKVVLTRLLKGIAEDAHGVAAVVNAVHALADAVQRLF
jgi:hypothetical protein